MLKLIPPIASNASFKGFTLIELIIVMAVAAVIYYNKRRIRYHKKRPIPRT